MLQRQTSFRTCVTKDLEDHLRQLRLQSDVEGEADEEIDKNIDFIHELAKGVTIEFHTVSWLTLVKHVVCFIPILALGGWLLSIVEGPGEEERALKRKADSQDLQDALDLAILNGCLNRTTLQLVDRRCKLDLEPFTQKAMDWSITGGVFMVTQVITTVGYGTFAPVTTLGKAIVCFVALFGIGWFAYFLVLLSEKEHMLLRWFVMKRIDAHSSVPAMIRTLRVRTKTFVLLALAVILYLSGLGAAAVAYHAYWGACLDQSDDCNYTSNFIDAVYFSLVTFSTVGLGDIAPPFWDVHRPYWQIYSLWIGWSGTLLIGLSLLSFILAEVDIMLRERAFQSTLSLVLKAYNKVESSYRSALISHISSVAPHHVPSILDFKQKLIRSFTNCSGLHLPLHLFKREVSPDSQTGSDTCLRHDSSQSHQETHECLDTLGEAAPPEDVLWERAQGDADLSSGNSLVESCRREDPQPTPKVELLVRPEYDAHVPAEDICQAADQDELRKSFNYCLDVPGRSLQKGATVVQKSSLEEDDDRQGREAFQDNLQHILSLLENTKMERWHENTKKAIELCKAEAYRSRQASSCGHDVEQLMVRVLHLLLE